MYTRVISILEIYFVSSTSDVASTLQKKISRTAAYCEHTKLMGPRSSGATANEGGSIESFSLENSTAQIAQKHFFVYINIKTSESP